MPSIDLMANGNFAKTMYSNKVPHMLLKAGFVILLAQGYLKLRLSF
jgi:hypothetical protein